MLAQAAPAPAASVSGSVPASGSAASAAPGPKTYHVAPDGSGPACSPARPCSLESARAKVRQALAEGMDRDVRVLLAGGTYRLTAPFTLGARDSGTGGHTVTWAAAPGQTPVLDGGVPITGWRREGDRVVAKVPDGVTPRQLFVGGGRAVLARGEACPANVCDATKTGMTGARALGIASWKRPSDAEAVIRVRWRNYQCRVTGVEGDVITFAQPCWGNSASGTGRTGPAWDTTTVDSSRYRGVSFFQNAIELLDEPGEFAWDSAARTVTYLPRPGEDPETAVTPVTENLLVLDGARDVRVEGLTFAHAAYRQPGTAEGYAGTQAGLTLTGATGPVDHAGRFYTKPAAAVVVRGGRNVTVDGAAFTRLGGAGVILERGTQDSSVTRSRFTDLSSGAVYVGDMEPNPEPELTGLRNTVSYNTIRHTGVEYTDAVGIWAGYEAELTIDHNTLEKLPYSGISVGWGWNQPEAREPVLRDNKITNNRVVDAMMVEFDQHDGGAIYTQGPQPGTVISGNYLNRSAFGNTERDGNGVYLDEQSSHIRVERNVITRVAYKWVSNWAGYGVENIARHNWTDTTAPALSGRGSQMVDNHTSLRELPPEALEVARRAGASPGSGEVERLAPDLARDGVASQSSTEGAAEAGLAVDGSIVTDSRTRSEPGAWWQVDLGSVRRVGSVEIWNDASMTTAGFEVQVAATADFAGARMVPVAGRALRPSLVTVGAEGRYVRIRLTGTGRVGLSGVAVRP
ncbi:right-handed parallel beta-helix repeat-containing protein [Bailinhaonella thermotolerans]|uniref:Right-handed parallel beta-helix repeat-containing protein n=1 Tax=Bailinhaonella thermotolerans TaxID=1070861 RepID=A0A3A4BPG4_9ACTN|nr:right-handed parallel beta-helix repeat-containing protein [Bailinhaonella thermotolerans]